MGCPCSARPSGTIAAVVNALAKAWIELGENGSSFPRPRGKPRFEGRADRSRRPWLLGLGLRRYLFRGTRTCRNKTNARVQSTGSIGLELSKYMQPSGQADRRQQEGHPA